MMMVMFILPSMAFVGMMRVLMMVMFILTSMAFVGMMMVFMMVVMSFIPGLNAEVRMWARQSPADTQNQQ